ncbi:unnamed protein product [Ectocarpus fasciculatus]
MSEAEGRSELDPQQARIHPTVVKKLLQLHWNKDPAADGAKINPDAAVLTAEYLRLFVIEAHNRAMIEAEVDGDEAGLSPFTFKISTDVQAVMGCTSARILCHDARKPRRQVERRARYPHRASRPWRSFAKALVLSF